MNMLSSFLVAAGLSMDNLAVTVSAGCSQQTKGHSRTLWRVSFLFALAHFVMFAIGFEGGILLHAGKKIAPWLACAILVCIGIRMIKNAFASHGQAQPPLLNSFHTQIMLALATSMDALLVGAGLALATTSFWQTTAVLVVCVFITSLCGFYLGRYLGGKFGRNMEILGGLVLVFLGVKVLLEGVGIW